MVKVRNIRILQNKSGAYYLINPLKLNEYRDKSFLSISQSDLGLPLLISAIFQSCGFGSGWSVFESDEKSRGPKVTRYKLIIHWSAQSLEGPIIENLYPLDWKYLNSSEIDETDRSNWLSHS